MPAAWRTSRRFAGADTQSTPPPPTPSAVRVGHVGPPPRAEEGGEGGSESPGEQREADGGRPDDGIRGSDVSAVDAREWRRRRRRGRRRGRGGALHEGRGGVRRRDHPPDDEEGRTDRRADPTPHMKPSSVPTLKPSDRSSTVFAAAPTASDASPASVIVPPRAVATIPRAKLPFEASDTSRVSRPPGGAVSVNGSDVQIPSPLIRYEDYTNRTTASRHRRVRG